MNQLKNILIEKGCSCVIRKNDVIRTFGRRGVIDLYDLYMHEPDFLKNAYVADKAVGKGAATIMISGGIKDVYAGIISRPAMELFERYGVTYTYGQKVPIILNRTKKDSCPLEKRCTEENTIEKLLPIIKNFVEEIINHQK